MKTWPFETPKPHVPQLKLITLILAFQRSPPKQAVHYRYMDQGWPPKHICQASPSLPCNYIHTHACIYLYISLGLLIVVLPLLSTKTELLSPAEAHREWGSATWKALGCRSPFAECARKPSLNSPQEASEILLMEAHWGCWRVLRPLAQIPTNLARLASY